MGQPDDTPEVIDPLALGEAVASQLGGEWHVDEIRLEDQDTGERGG